MFIFLAYVSLALIQFYRRCQRRLQYSAAMLRALRNGSILVQRGKNAQHGSVGVLLNSSLLSCSRSYKETLLLSDEHLAVSNIIPKQQIDLGEWTSYLDLHPAQANSHSVVALLEAGPADPSQATPQQVPLASRVQVLKHGCPLAWKSGNPFGIILRCSQEDFVILCDAFGQGQLTLNEDLQLYRMLTVSTVGKPKSLRRPRSEEITSATERDHLKTRRANTDPARLLSSMDNNLSVCNLVVADMVKTSGISSDLAAKPKVELNGSVTGVKNDKGLYTEILVSKNLDSGSESKVFKSSQTSAAQKSIGSEHSESDQVSGDDTGMTRNGNEVMVQGNSIVLEESPVVRMSFDFPNGSKKNVLPCSGSPETLKSLSAEINDKSDETSLHEKEVMSEKRVPVSSALDDASGKNVSDLNGCEEHPDTYVKDCSLSKTESQLKESTEDEDMKISVAENVLVSKKDSNALNTGSESVRPKAEAESSTSSGDAQQNANKPTDKAINGSPPFINGSNGAGVSELAKHTAGAGDTVISSCESSQFSKGEESSVSSRNGVVHDIIDDKSRAQATCKPPNVVVYCGKKDSARKFDIIREALEQCLNPSAYTVYILPHEEVMTLPWEDNSAALIISHDYLHDNVGKKFTNFLLNGGKVLSFGSSLEAEFLVRKEVKGRPFVTKFDLQKWRDVNAVQGRYHYVPGSLKQGNSSMDTLVVEPSSAQPLVVRLTLSAEHGNGSAIFSQLFLERDPSEMASDSKSFSRLKQSSKQRWEVLRHLLSLLDLDTSSVPSLPLTPCYLLVQDQAIRKTFLDSIAGRMKQNTIRSRALTLKFVSAMSGSSALTATKDSLPVITDVPAGSFKGAQDDGKLQFFDPTEYWRHLTTSVLGRMVMYTEIIPTTMTLFEGIQFSLPEEVGVIAVAGRQTSGKGRGENQWLSPAGCAMFTLPLRLPTESPLGQHVSFLQHIVSLSVVHSVRTMPGYEDLDLRLKWPNDIYYGNKAKLGGVLVSSTTMGKHMHATVGCGVNVSNTLPTVCINSVIQEHNASRGSNLRPMTTSEVLARTVSTLETLVSQFQDKGHEDFCQLYYKYWLHSGTCVKVESEGNADVEIVGLDDFGFLRVVNKQGQQFSVHPDGNSFDMLRNLISVKRD